MLRSFGYCFGLIVCCWGLDLRGQGAGDALISRPVAQRNGLVRAWHTQIQLERGLGKIAHVTFHGGTLFVQTNQATLHAIDGETGRTLWAEQVGRRGSISMAAAANGKYVAIITGSTLYVLDRRRGDVQWERQLGGSPGAGPALSETHVFVPMVSGRLEGYPLVGKQLIPWVYKSAGRVLYPPMATPNSISWTTDKGHFYVADAEKLSIRYRLETHKPFESQPAYWTPYLYACSTDGYAYAIDQESGQFNWKFPAGYPISEPPVAINGRVYIEREQGGMHCLDGATGEEIWFSGGLTQFISLSPTKVYAVQGRDRLMIVDAASGARLGGFPIPGVTLKLINRMTDRIYLGTDSGILQCLRESELRAPVVYTPPTLPTQGEKATKAKELKAKEPKAKEKPAEPKGDDAAADDAEEKPEKPAKKAKKDQAEEADPFDSK